MTTRRLVHICIVAAVIVLLAAPAKGLPPPPDASPKEDNGVRVVSLPRTKVAAPLAYYVASTKVKLPSAVLVLCPDNEQDAKVLLHETAWQNFAEDHSLGLVALTTAKAPASPTENPQPPSNKSQAEIVFQAVDHEFGGEIPLLLYGWPQHAALAENLLAANPKRVRSWCFRAPAHVPDARNAAPPGIVVCYKENKSAYSTLMKEFARGRKAAQRLTWIALPGEKPKESKLPTLDIFVRNYFDAVLSSKIGFDQWQNIDTKQAISAMDVNSHPEVASYLPRAALASAWAALHVPGGPAIAQQTILEREVDTFNRAQPKLHLYLRRPTNAGDPNGKIEGVLAYCTWEKDRAKIVNRLQDPHYYLVRYAEERHLALLTWDTAKAFSNRESADERSQQENFRDDLGFDKLADAWERGVHALCYEAGLPENSFLLYGLSLGAQWAHRLALRKPDHFLAVHIHINSSYDWPTLAARNILWLQTTGEREYGYEAAKRFYARCREMGYPIIFKVGVNLGHQSSPQIEEIGQRFFDYALGVKVKCDGVIAAAHRSTIGKPASPDLYALSGLDQAPYYADFVNQEVYGREQKDMIPDGQRVPLPTKALAQAWGEIVDTPALTTVTNSEVPPPKPPAASTSTEKQSNYFGASAPGNQQDQAIASSLSALPLAADAASKNKQVALTNPAGEKQPALSVKQEAAHPDIESKHQLSMQRTLAQYPQLAQAGSAHNVAFVNEYSKLKESNNPLLIDPTWPEQVARIMHDQLAVSSGFQHEFQESVRRAVRVYPSLSQADSAMNAAFLKEYRRLKEADSPLLTDPTWPEQMARDLGKRSANR
jgi:pimeloyl-ACP methyl ester carboxylesterase